jgi:hypothetical protein
LCALAVQVLPWFFVRCVGSLTECFGWLTRFQFQTDTKKAWNPYFARSHTQRFFATHVHRNRQRITTPYRYNKGIQNYAYRYDTPLRSFIVAKFLMYVECCEDSEHQKQSAINALHIYVLCPTRRFATASD